MSILRRGLTQGEDRWIREKVKRAMEQCGPDATLDDYALVAVTMTQNLMDRLPEDPPPPM